MTWTHLPIAALILTVSMMCCPAASFALEEKPGLRFSEITHLASSGKTQEALEAVESSLKAKPRDPQLRFLQGLLLTQSDRQSEAIAVFTALTEEFPNLPEPYNNLAALQAANGQTGQARVSLEAAVRADPNYSVAHENLADVHLRLSLEAYQRALAVGGDGRLLVPKIKQLQQLIEDPKRTVETLAKP
jgi:tetratricopeptide (TPR) repeat protein